MLLFIKIQVNIMITIHAHIIYIIMSPNIFRLILRHHPGEKCKGIYRMFQDK